MKLRLASSGYFGGDPERVGRASADWVLAALQFEQMKAEYEESFLEMNKGK